LTSVAAFSVLALTVGLSLARPSVGRYRINPPSAAVIGAFLMIGLGLISIPAVGGALRVLLFPVLTIISLMIITIVAELAGFFRLLAYRIAIAAGGDGKRLFTYLFVAGTVTGAMFTNDAAVLIFTPLVFNLIEEVEEPSWSGANKLPYYFAVLYIANVVAVFVISNPINIIVASLFDIQFLEYTLWMFLPAVVSIVVSYIGLRIFFRNSIPATYRMPQTVVHNPASQRFWRISGAVLVLTLLGLFTGQLTGLPVWIITCSGAIALLVVYRISVGGSMIPIGRGIGWDVIIFIVGIFIVANGLRGVGLTNSIGDLISIGIDQQNLPLATSITAFVAAGTSAVINNHPTADMMALTIRDLGLSDFDSKMMAFSALIGGDLGPKMLPIGSLAALLWFRMLRTRGVDISYTMYIKIGIPVSLAAIVMAVFVLNIEIWITRSFF
jgi:arsenical pump membrane protein